MLYLGEEHDQNRIAMERLTRNGLGIMVPCTDCCLSLGGPSCSFAKCTGQITGRFDFPRLGFARA